jgi:hypothetical protein
MILVCFFFASTVATRGLRPSYRLFKLLSAKPA